MKRIAILALLVATPSLTYAQATSVTPQRVRTESKWHFGPFYVTPAVRLENLGWDSNVFNETENTKSDFTFTVSPKADVWLPIKNRFLITSTLDLDMVWYAKYKEQRSINPLASIDGTIFLNRLTMSAGYQHIKTRDRASNEIDLRAERVQQTARLAIDYSFSRKLTAGVSGERRATDFGDELFLGESLEQNLDRFTGRAGGTVSYALTPLTTVSLNLDRGVERFAFAPERDSDSWTLLPRVQFKPRALIRGSAAMGFRWFLPVAGSTLPAFRGLVMEADLAYTLRGATVFTVNWGRAVAYSFQSETPYYLDNRLGGSVRRMIGRSFDILVSTDRHVYDYRSRTSAGVGVLPAPDPRQSDATWYSTGSVGYRIGRDGRIGAGVVHWLRRSSTEQVPDYERLQFTIAFSYGL